MKCLRDKRSLLCSILVAAYGCSSSEQPNDGANSLAGQTSGNVAGTGAGGAPPQSNGTAGAPQAMAGSGPAAAGGGGSGNDSAGASNGGSDGAMAGADSGGASGSAGASNDNGHHMAKTCGMPVVNANPGNTCHDAPPPALKLTPIVMPGGDLFAPLVAVSPPGDTSRLFVIERVGVVRVIKDGQLLETPFADISDEVANNTGRAEIGLLGIAFDPDFANNRKVWLHYNDPDFDSNVASLQASEANPDIADPASFSGPLLTVDQPAGRNNHKGGMIAFGKDGCFYVGYGDGGAMGDPDGRGQDTTEPMASVLRLDHNNGFVAAPGNPDYGDNRIWSYGYRNPYRFSFDFPSGDMYVGDVGQDLFEEVNVEPAGTGDFNYGWKVAEGFTGDTDGKRSPLLAYGRADGLSITGGFVYRGSAIPGMVGRYIYGDFETDNMWVLTYKGELDGAPEVCDEYDITDDLALPVVGADDGPSGFGQDGNGELYVLTLQGGVFKVEAE